MMSVDELVFLVRILREVCTKKRNTFFSIINSDLASKRNVVVTVLQLLDCILAIKDKLTVHGEAIGRELSACSATRKKSH